jgi:pilus assembly protein FimV
MLVAMYRANVDEFDDKNMNRLQTGKILRVPESKELDKVVQDEAVKEIRTQAEDWNAYRLKMAAAIGTHPEEAPKQIVTGKISTTVADKTPAAKQSAKEVVRLSKGEVPGDKAVAGGNGKVMQDKLHAMEEDATARNKTLKESNERIALLEKNIKEMQRLVELKGQLAQSAKAAQGKVEETQSKVPENKPALAQQGAASATVKTATVVPENQTASAVVPAKPAQPKIETPPPSLLDEILAEPLYLAGGAVAILGGLAFMLARRRGSVVNSKEDAVSAGTHIVAPVAPSPDTGDFTQISAAEAVISPPETEDVDPISEADLFLNFGRDVQAEEILKEALIKDPGNQNIRLKLLSIYSGRKDTKTFSRIAGEVQASGNAAAWAQAAEMGRKLEPGNPMYGGGDSAVAAAVEVPQNEIASAQATPSLDFDLGLGAPEDISATAPLDIPLDVKIPASADELDFDLGNDEPEASPAVAEQEAPAPQAAQPEEKTATLVDLDFDLGLDAPAETAEPASVPDEAAQEDSLLPSEPVNQEVETEESAPAEHEVPLDFDITSTHPDLSALEPEPALAQVGSPLQSTEIPVAEAAKEEQAAEKDSGKMEEEMTFSLDFPVEESSVADEAVPDSSAQTLAQDSNAIDLSEINLNLDTPAPAPAEEVKDTHWHDVATKLDLARAYQEMGDASGAREILDEVLNEGDAQQRAAAEVMRQQLSA